MTLNLNYSGYTSNILNNLFINCHFKTLLYILNFGQNYEL